MIAIGAGIAALACIGAGIGIGIATSKAAEAVARQPEAESKITKILLLGGALAEATAIYGFVIGILRLDINIVWTILNLLIIFAIVKIFLIKPIHKILDARQAEIDKQYADAKAAQDSADELKTKYEASLSGVQAEKEGILNEARGKAGNEYDRIVADAQTEAKKILDNADKNAALEEQKRIQQAQEQIAGLVVEATAKLVAAKQNADSDRELYNQFIAKTGEEID